MYIYLHCCFQLFQYSLRFRYALGSSIYLAIGTDGEAPVFLKGEKPITWQIEDTFFSKLEKHLLCLFSTY